jgi:hypothetical protein
MAADASHALGVPEVAGTMVNPKGLTKKMTATVAGGVVGGAAGTLVASAATGGSPYKGAPGVPNFGRVGYLAASESDLALVKTKTGALKMKISDEILARVPRSEITSISLDKGMMVSRLKIAFANDVTWEFDIPKAGKKGAIAFVQKLGGTVD